MLPNSSSPSRRLLALVCLWATTSGCARWNEEPRNQSPALPLVGENSKSIILDVEFIPVAVDEEDVDQELSLWRWVDETVIDTAQRRNLVANGLRAGKVINVEKLRRRLEVLEPAQGALDQFLATAAVASEVSHNGKRIPMRMGKRYELMLKQPMKGSHVSLVRLGDETVGRTLEDPQFLFALRSTAGRSTGQIDVRLRPEIQHGRTKPQWVSSDTAWRIDSRRQSWSLDSLDIHLPMAEGDTFVVTAAAPVGGLAKQMLTGDAADHSVQRLVVLIRADQIPGPRDKL